jgi:hypothetical protein
MMTLLGSDSQGSEGANARPWTTTSFSDVYSRVQKYPLKPNSSVVEQVVKKSEDRTELSPEAGLETSS